MNRARVFEGVMMRNRVFLVCPAHVKDDDRQHDRDGRMGMDY